jgi:hypothetical protein
MSGLAKIKIWVKALDDKPIRDNVIAGLVVSLVCVMGTSLMSLLGAWPTLSGWLSKSISLPTWVGLAGLGACGQVMFSVTRGVIRNRRASAWRKYQEDLIFDFIWRWRWGASKKEEDVVELTAYCPRDDTRISWCGPRDENIGFCPHCGYKTRPALNLEAHLKFERIPSCIGRNVRNGDWKLAAERIARRRSKLERGEDGVVEEKAGFWN